ncbi:MAG TPA: SH3 domain-containing protein, partial [Reyranella sp.]
MRAPRLPIVLLGLSLATTQAAVAEPIDTTGAIQCEASGFSIDPDPKGTNLRSAPRVNAPVIGRLAPRTRITPVEIVGVTFDIVGSKDGWLLIKNGNPEPDFMLGPANAADGRGWVSGRLVGTTLAAISLRIAPRWDAPVVASFAMPGSSPVSVVVSTVHGCRGKYAEVTGTPINGKTVRGWSYSPCSSQL